MTLIENKKARLEYSFVEEIEAGIELRGYEVKSLRAGRGNLAGAHIVARPTSPRLRRTGGGYEAYLVGATIPAWQPANAPKSYDPERTRRLLLSPKEIAQIATAERTKGLTIVPISVYNKQRHLKLRIAIARGKKAHDKREDIKKRDTERDMRRSMRE